MTTTQSCAADLVPWCRTNYFRRGIEPDSGIRGKRVNITEHEMRGLLTGKCIPGDMRVNEELPAYLVRKFAEIKAQRDALAAENATIKTMNDFLSEELRGYESDGAYDGPIAHKLWHSNSETPATAAHLNSVQAGAVEDAAKRLFGQGYTFEVLTRFAAQLRAGKDGE